MDDERQRKRRRLYHSEITTITLDISCPSAHVKNEIGRECRAFNLGADAAASRAVDRMVTGIGDSVSPDLVCYGMV